VRLDAVRLPTDADLLRAETVVVHGRATRLVEDDDRRKESLPTCARPSKAGSGWATSGSRCGPA
jgi:hypothetical protein